MDDSINVSDALWNDEDTEKYSNETFYHMLMEQYKLYVEMADRIYARRNLANTFFLTLHALILSMLGLSLSHSPILPNPGMLAFPLLGLLLLCYAWWRLVQYFRRLSFAKGQVIRELECRLPSNPTWAGENSALQVSRPYNPVRRMEISLPFIFAGLYIFAFVYVLYLSW